MNCINIYENSLNEKICDEIRIMFVAHEEQLKQKSEIACNTECYEIPNNDKIWIHIERILITELLNKVKKYMEIVENL